MTNSSTVPTRNPARPQETLEGFFPYLLAAVSLAALVPMLVLGTSEFISYDGYWHLFVDTQNKWRLFMFEYRGDAHPIVYHLLIRFVGLFGHSRLLLRSASIIPGVGSIFLIGLIGSRLCRNKLVALLIAAAYGFSMVMIQIEIDVRSYPLCLFFVLTSFYFLVEFLGSGSGALSNRSLILFGVFASAAIATEYYALFYLVTCILITALAMATDAGIRQNAIGWLLANWRAPLIALLLPFATIAFFYWTHIRFQPPTYGHVNEFYWTPGSPRLDFILRNLRADLNYILPVEIGTTGMLLAVLALGGSTIVIFSFFQLRSRRTVSAGLPGLLVLLILFELIVVSLLRRYPFGGFERQQSILFPFMILAGFILLDRVVSHIPSAWGSTALLGMCAILIGFNFYHGWHKTPRRSEELFTREYSTFQAKNKPEQAIYVDQFSLIGLYIHTNEWKWNFYRHFHEPDRIDEYRLTTLDHKNLLLLRDIDLWNFDLVNPRNYEVLARSLRDAQLTGASLFLLKQVAGPLHPADLAAQEAEIGRLSAAAGLRIASIYDDSAQAAISFETAEHGAVLDSEIVTAR